MHYIISCVFAHRYHGTYHLGSEASEKDYYIGILANCSSRLDST